MNIFYSECFILDFSTVNIEDLAVKRGGRLISTKKFCFDLFEMMQLEFFLQNQRYFQLSFSNNFPEEMSKNLSLGAIIRRSLGGK